jgi:hypothetical protein
VLGDEAATQAVVRGASVVIYASGCEAVLADLPSSTPALEYLHTPEPAGIESVRTLLARLFPDEVIQGKEALAR